MENNGATPSENYKYTGKVGRCKSRGVVSPTGHKKAEIETSFCIGEDDAEKSQNEIQREIYKNGPVIAGMAVFTDLQDYKGGIYKQEKGEMIGLHAIVITGWGMKDGVKYWVVRNSWSEEWGEKGYFRIQFGECGIDNFGLKQFMERPMNVANFSAQFRERKYGGIISTIPNVRRVITDDMKSIIKNYNDIPNSISFQADNCVKINKTKFCIKSFNNYTFIVTGGIIILILYLILRRK